MNKSDHPIAKPDRARPAAQDSDVVLRILATSDLHMHVNSFDYSANGPSANTGLSRVATLISAARAEAGHDNCLLLDNGDFLQGNALGDYLAQASGNLPNPMIAAMNHLGYDAVNLGNHEFSLGLGYLQACLGQMAFPCISSNIWHSGDRADFVAPWVILDRDLRDRHCTKHHVRIGIAGVLPPQTAMWDSTNINGKLTMGPMRDTLARVLPRIRAAGADVIVVLAHCGPGTAEDGADAFAENMGLAIAELPDVDALIMGHVHLAFPTASGPAMPRGIPAVMTGAMGSHLGVIDLHLRHDESGWHVGHGGAEARSVAARDAGGAVVPLIAPDPAIERIAAPAHTAALGWMNSPIARIDRPLHSYFALINDSPVVQIVNRAKIDYLTKRLRGTEWQGLPVLSCNSPARAGARGGAGNYCHIPAGDFLLRHATDIDPHPNSIVAMRLTGADLRRWLDRSVQVFRRIARGMQDEPLLCADKPPFNFDTIGGLTYRIDLGAAGFEQGESRIRDLGYQGRDIDDDDSFIVGMSSYRASGSGGFAEGLSDRIVLADDITCREILIDFLRDRDGNLPPREEGWRFAPMPETTVIFETAPGAADHLAELPGIRIDPLDLTAEGFRRFRLHL